MSKIHKIVPFDLICSHFASNPKVQFICHVVDAPPIDTIANEQIPNNIFKWSVDSVHMQVHARGGMRPEVIYGI